MSDREIRVAALRMAGRWFVDDLPLVLDLPRTEWGTQVWHVVRDLVDEGLVGRTHEGYAVLSTRGVEE